VKDECIFKNCECFCWANSLFYLAAALAKAEQTETASDTLKQAITTMDMTVEGFVSSQGYKNQEKRDELLQTLEPIAV